ncbi:MAG: hypothetical protein KKH34_08090 [Candidatus Omnitrophica bacterium]|nr:hypothetical protein [Candidatus Omnitrophota bacterium]
MQPNGDLVSKFTFGKEGKGLGEFGFIENLAIKNNFFYVSDTGNNCIQILEIK